MDLFNPILTIAIFALYTFIFSLFIVPPLKDLRQIRTGLRGLVTSRSFLKREKQEERRRQRKQITDVLKDYRLRYQEIRQATRFLAYGGVATILTCLFLFISTVPVEERAIHYFFYNPDILVFVIYIAVIFILMIVSFVLYTPSPDRIIEWTYLVKNYGLSPSGLAECANLKIDFNPKSRSIFEHHDPREKRPIRIFSDIELVGYKYWFFIYDLDGNEVLLNLIGIVDKKTGLEERFFDFDDFYGWFTVVGKFDAYSFKNKKLRMFFFVFGPVLFGDVGEPYWGYSDFYCDGTVKWSSTNIVSLQKGTYSKIRYYGSGLNFSKFEWYEYENNFPLEYFSKIKSEQQWSIVKGVFDSSCKLLLKNKLALYLERNLSVLAENKKRTVNKLSFCYNLTMNHQSTHQMHSGHSISMFKNRFFISLFLTIFVVYFSYFSNLENNSYLVFAFSSLVFFYGGKPFFVGAKNELKNKTIGMMSLIAIATFVSYFYSSFVVFGLSGKIFFVELVSLIDIMLLGHWIEMRSVLSASASLEKLVALIPNKAHLLRGDNFVDVLTVEIKNGDDILVKAGEKIPADGLVFDGAGSVNESMLTGESSLVSKKIGDKVVGGSINEDGLLKIKVSGVGENSYLSKVVSLVRQAQASKSKTQNLADKVAFWLAVVAVSVGLVTFGVWFFVGGGVAFAIERAVTVLVITCPHALGLAIPLVVAVSTTLSAKNGFLIRNRVAFENSRKITTVVFDKTGTLTEGKLSLKNIFSFSEKYNEDDILQIFAGLENNSEHLIAKAVVGEAKRRNLKMPAVENFKIIKGKGLEGFVLGEKMVVASYAFLRELGLSVPDSLENTTGTVAFLISDGVLLGAMNFVDAIREESFDAIKMIKENGIRVWMLTGDNEKVAKNVSDSLGLNGYFANVLPEEKLLKIKELQEKGEFVAMVGDGINDAPALAQADVGIAIGSGTDIAAETADIILVDNNPKSVFSVIVFGRKVYNKMLQNLIWATGYNIVAIPLAAGVLFTYGILLSPAVGAISMSLSTVVVAVNARMLGLERNGEF